MTDRAAFIAGLIGTPYDRVERHCWWLAAIVQLELFGRELPASGYVDRHERARILASHPERARWRQVERPADGDIVLMGRVAGRDTHSGVYLGDRQGVIHTDQAHGVVVDRIVELQQARGWRLSFYRCEVVA